MASTSTAEDDAHVWGQMLVKLPENLAANSTDEEKAVFKKIIPLYGQRFTIGRAYDCKYQLIKKTVSNYHCYITKDGEKVLLFDTSTNGTVINRTTKITNGQNYQLQDKDEIYLMRQKGNPYKDFCLIYQIILDLPNRSTTKEDTQCEPVKKKIKLEPPADFEETCSNPCDNFTQKVESQDDNLHDTDECMSEEDVCSKSGDTKPFRSKSQDQHMDLNHSSSKSNQLRLHVATNVAPDTIGRSNDFCQSTSLADKSNTSTPVKNYVVEASVTNQLMPDDIPVSISLLDNNNNNNNENQENSSVPRLEEKSVDGIEETLQCSLCIELLHEPVCLQPCLHCYCSGCYSQWMKKSKQCPQCRRYVESLSKNHIVSNLVEAFLNSHPEKSRSASDIEKLNEANSIKSDIVKFKKDDQLENASDNSSTDGYNDDDDDDDDDDSALFFSGIPIGVAIPFQNFRSNVSCQQCPNSLKKGSENSKKLKTVQKTVAGNSTGSTPSTSQTVSCKTKGESSNDAKDSEQQIASNDFVCRPDQLHITCYCCQELMPDRRTEKLQQCSICSSTFCHLYFGCKKSSCEGCLNQFKDLKFNDLDLLRGVGNNVIESRILLDFLSSNGKSWKTCFVECMTALDAGRFHTMPASKSDSVICNSCGLRQLKTLLYNFRRNIPKALLPNEVTSRPDCYWGKHCRTQEHKMSHAERFNHICEQSRFRP